MARRRRCWWEGSGAAASSSMARRRCCSIFSFSFVLVLLLAVVSETKENPAGHDDSGQQESYVLILDSSNFTETIQKHSFIVVEFYAPWCGHCKRLAPEYEKASATLQTYDPPIVLAKVDANSETNKGLAGDYGVRGFPTLKIIRNNGTVVQDYKGPREADGIVSYLKKQNGPPSEEITSAEQGAKLIEEHDIVIVGVFPSFDLEEYANFTAVADQLRSDYEFRHTSDATFLPLEGVALTAPAIRLFKKFDDGFSDTKRFSVEAVTKFVEDESMPLILTMNSDAANRPYLVKFFSRPGTKVMLFANLTAVGAGEYKPVYTQLAQAYKEKGLKFLFADVNDSQNALEYFGLKADKLPSIVLQENEGKKYALEQVQVRQLASWLKDYTDGLLEEYFKSQPIPEKNDEPVKVVVGSTLQEMVLNSGKNVLLEFYAPWCGHCKKLAPILEEIAISFQSDPEVVIAKLDATANDIRTNLFEVSGYPTLYLYSASGHVISYTGNQTAENIIEFINKNRDKVGRIQIAKESIEAELSRDEL